MEKAIFHPIQVLKKEHDTLKFKYALEVKKHAETMTSLGNEKADKNALQVEIKH